MVDVDLDKNVLLNVKTRRAEIEPRFLVSAINPRDLSDLQGHILMPAIEKTSGVITKPLVWWKPVDSQGNFDPNHPIWNEVRDTLTDEFVDIPVEERKKFRIIVQGHRREWCASTALANPQKYPAEMLKNLAKLPGLEISCSQEEAEEVALDFEESEPLHSWNTVMLVGKLLAKDINYQEVCLRMPRLLFQALLGQGAARYNKVLREHPDGRERRAAIVKALRNRVDTHINSAHMFGSAPMQQLILHFRYAENQLEDIGDKHLLVVDFKYAKVQKLRELYTKLIKAGETWIPISRIEVTDEKPGENDLDVSWQPCPSGLGVNYDGKFFVVEGGHPEFREALIDNMRVKATGIEPEVVKPPTATERTHVVGRTSSGVGKAFCQYFDKTSTESVSGPYLTEPRTREEWESWAQFAESVHARLITLADDVTSDLVKELLKSLTNVSAPGFSAKRVEQAVLSVDEALKAVATK